MTRLAWLLVAVAVLICAACADAQSAGQVQNATQAYVQQQVGTFEKYQDWVVGNPLGEVYNFADVVKKKNVPYYVISFATMIAFLGFVTNMWRAYKFEDTKLLRDGFWTFVVSGILIAGCFNYGNRLPTSLSSMLLGGWGSTYAWSKASYGDALDQKLRESSEKFTQMLGEVVVAATTVAIPESKVLGMANPKALAAAVRKGEGTALRQETRAGTAAAGKTPLANTAAAMNFTANFLTGLIVIYSQLITYSGFGTLLIVYVLPIALALLNWGSSRHVWTCLCTFIAMWLTVIFLPMITYVAIDKVFVQPARVADYYKEELGLRVTAMEALSNQFNQHVNTENRKALDACANAMNASPEGADTPQCKALEQGTWFDRLLTKLEGGLKSAALQITGFVTGIVDDFTAIVWKVVFSAIFFAVAIALMTWVSIFLTNLLGGVASEIRPGFNLPNLRLGGKR